MKKEPNLNLTDKGIKNYQKKLCCRKNISVQKYPLNMKVKKRLTDCL